MSEMRAILEDTCAKLFARFEEPAVLRRVEEGFWPADLWSAISEAGLDQIFSGASDDPWRDACVVIKACGRHVLPAPLPETLMANAVLARAGKPTLEGVLTLAGTSQSELDTDRRHFCTFSRVAWARHTDWCLAESNGQLIISPASQWPYTEGSSISREPRDELHRPVLDEERIPTNDAQVDSHGALMRAAQMAGCIEAVLAMTVSYARERQQFGKPIGSFQAIQHQLAILAGHSAAASRIVDAAFDRVAEGGDIELESAVAKIRCGEAAGVAASIAHQTHGAIGFTDEHRLHYYTRRLWSWRSEFGSEAYWSGVLGRRVAEAGADGFWPFVTAAG